MVLFVGCRIYDDTRTLTIQYYKKPGDFQAAGTLSCGVESAVEVIDPPHIVSAVRVLCVVCVRVCVGWKCVWAILFWFALVLETPHVR